MLKRSDTSDSDWEPTATQNLFRYKPSGTYFARFKMGGKPVRQSLETTVYSVAKQRLSEKMREYRMHHESVQAFANGKMTVNDAAQVYLSKIEGSVTLKPRSKSYFKQLVDFIDRTWPTLMEADIRKVTERECQTWLTEFNRR